MNEKTDFATPDGLKETLTAFRSPVPVERPGSPARPARRRKRPALRLENLRDSNLKGMDLTKQTGLLPEHLAGADLTGAKLPDHIADFPALGQVAAISSEARKIFIGLLAACVYSWLVIGTTTDVDLILNTATSPLPIINTPIPIAGFYVVGAALLAAVYCYFHFYLQRLWRTLGGLPAILPDGVALDDKTDPWLLTNLVRADFKRLRRSAPPLTRLENPLTILLAWWLVPMTLLALWARYLPAHYWLGTTWLIALIGVTALFGRHSYRLARATLRGEAPVAEDERDDGHAVLSRAWHEFCQIRPDPLTNSLIVLLVVCSLSAFRDDPRDEYTWGAKLLNLVGIRTFADIREVTMVQRPAGWTGKEWDKVKRVDLRDRNLAFADASSAFLVNADLRGANLADANLTNAQLQGADLRYAQLQGAELENAWLQGARLANAQLQGADLEDAELQGADLANAQLQGATLEAAGLTGALLWGAQLQGADLSGARLLGADITSAELQGADLRRAHLQCADLRYAQLQGADMREAEFWRTSVDAAQWDLADVRGINVLMLIDPDIADAVTSEIAQVPNEQSRKALTDSLFGESGTKDRSAGLDFPKTWRSEPNVMFQPGDPQGEPINWGPLKWATERAYDEELAKFLGHLACGRDEPEALARRLAWRALSTADQRGPGRLWPQRLAERIAGPDCPPAKDLPDNARYPLEQLATRAAPAAGPETPHPMVE